MKEKKNTIILFCIAFLFTTVQNIVAQNNDNDYVVLASKSVEKDLDWNKVVSELSEIHQDAKIFYYEEHPDELTKEIRNTNPRYVGIVEKPERLSRDFIIRLNLFSRTIKDNIFVDFLWGIITGYNAEGASKMIKNSEEPLVIKSCVSTIMETAEGKWFEKYAYIDDQNMGIYGYKMPWDENIKRSAVHKRIPATRGTKLVPNLLPIFHEMYKTIDPDLIITASHANETTLEMPFSAGFVKSKNGVLYAELPEGNIDLFESGKRRVYLPIGNCLIGNIDNSKESISIAWMNSANVTTFVGYVVSTWHGRSGWGGLKYFLTTPGRYTIAESFFLNQQDMLTQMNEWYPELNNVPYKFYEQRTQKAAEELKDILNREPTKDEIGFWYDRDVLAIYGDPKWDVRLEEIPMENDFSVTGKTVGNQYILTIKTGLNFSPRLISGDYFKEVHVLDIPFSHIFPKRLKNARLAEGQKWDVALSDDFILIYNHKFRPNNSYQIVLNIDENV